MDNFEATMSLKNEKPTFVSLFCGLGGLDLGFHWEDFELLWANDLERHATESFALNFGFKPQCGDLTQISIDDIPDSDIIVGGPPCQSFSLVGKREPSDERGKLVFRFLQIIGRKQPRAFIMENVPGIASSMINGIRLTEYLQKAYEDLGYHVTCMEVMATDYLVPQKRKRVIMVGAKDFLPVRPDKVQYARECYGLDFHGYDLSALAAIGDLGPCTNRGGLATYNDREPSEFAKIMRMGNGGTFTLHETPRMSATDATMIKFIPPGGNFQDVPDAVATGRILKFKQTGGRTTTYGRLHPEKPSYTINTYFRRPNVGCHFHYSDPRLITPREAMRFQSFPDYFNTVKAAQDKRNALIGNAVPPLMARALAWGIKKQLFEEAFDSEETIRLASGIA
jgi:DNA (cytosine-5)-methyltransferase 1